MGSLVRSPGFTGDVFFELGSDSATHKGITPFFRLLPPERVGLNGEYDHSGLAKRVDRVLHQVFLPQELENLSITQRGRVVILTGYAPNAYLLQQFADIAASVSGANTVETLGVKLAA